MFFEAAIARRELARHLNTLNYSIDGHIWSQLCMAIKRDIQAKRLRPNVSVPPRSNPVAFLKTMTRETNSVAKALVALAHDGPWTSSGGSFRLAEEVGVSIEEEARRFIAYKRSFRFLEIGAAWAGFGGNQTQKDGKSNIATLSNAFWQERAENVFLHFTNLTPWHSALPDGVYEHPYVTAAGLSILERQGVRAGSVDFLFSQAAAYFEADHLGFIRSAGRLLAEGGMMIFNHKPELGTELDRFASAIGLELVTRKSIGGMNGDVVRYDRPRSGAPVILLPNPGDALLREAFV